MIGRHFSIAITLSLLRDGVLELAPVLDCGAVTGPSRGIGLSVHSTVNSTGEWLSFSALNDLSSSSSNLSLDVKHRVIECGGKQRIQVYGFIKGNPADNFDERLSFHHKCGKNVALINNGLTAKKLNEEDRLNAVVFTNRPLKSNELFEVKLDKKGTKFGFINGIAVTTLSPNDSNIPHHMNSVSTGTWTLYGKSIWRNATVIFNNYLPLNDLQIGDRLAVMRSNTGALHFFVNGKDYGPGVSNIPEPVYGAFDMYGDALEVTIMDT